MIFSLKKLKVNKKREMKKRAFDLEQLDKSLIPKGMIGDDLIIHLSIEKYSWIKDQVKKEQQKRVNSKKFIESKIGVS